MSQPRKIALLPLIHLSWGRDLFDKICQLITETTDWEIVLSWPLLTSDIASEAFKSTHLDAVVGSLHGEETQKEIRRRGLTAICITHLCMVKNYHYVIPDDVALGELAADYLLSLKFNRFHFIGQPTHVNSEERFRAFRNQLQQSGYECSQTCASLDEISHKGITNTGIFHYIKSINKKTAIMCSDDGMASSVVRACKLLKKRIPEDVSLISTEDNRLIKTLLGKHTTAILYDIPKQAETVIETLHRLFRGESAPYIQTIRPLESIHGETTEHQIPDDLLVGKALKYIQSNFHDPTLNMGAVASMHGMSLRTMERRLKTYLQMTPPQFVRKIRIDKSKSLLTSTDYSIHEIASRCGFDYPQNFHRTFKKVTGQSPNTYRAAMKR